MQKTFVGTRLRELREERAMSQVELARLLDISPSYLNQIEHNSRPLTVPVLLRITETFGVDAGFFAARDVTRLIAEVREVFSDATLGLAVPEADAVALAEQMPRGAHALITLHRRYRQAGERLAALTGARGPEPAGPAPAPMPDEEVRDFFYQRQNYIGDLDEAAERLAAEIGLSPGRLLTVLTDRLAHHGVRVHIRDPAPDDRDLGADELHRFDPRTRVLTLSRHLNPGQRAFRLALQLGFTEFDGLITRLTDEGLPSGPAARTLIRIGLGNYFAAALILPYQAFHATAERFRYDVERLSGYFGMGFETICHRLSTLQRPRARGVAFSFIRVDRAGNMSKRQSATGFHFSRAGGTCPLWNVYEALAAPGRIHTQIATMPDGRSYFWIARTVSSGYGRFGRPGKTFAIGLGCELRQAHRLVYSTGLNLDDPAAAVPIGIGCKVCERVGCAQRAFPQIGRALALDANRGTFAPYPPDGLA
ncbi:short-chain fatty acyl-CoA regulator family protein [Frankia sp. AgKG'84/4]|uniref:short-chain fatty acyl-CoA regulator family protein n=1 Tax=Frankia sp. AgKG'84/4 TaxID=573490 RepID=UPI00200CF9D8|nr:short-chain fatty acyl-CoA regulator family protein [Frankia sp. AgKG'84/4]MCL9793469.1 short-chain fatty acyl-CoA regulator family protein [Frankia sp. AgKG'84/4]